MTTSIQQFFEEGCGRCEWSLTPHCKAKKWKEEITLLRELILHTGLKESIKWGFPCYTDNGKNIVMIGALKETCTLSFFKGSLLQDPTNILEKAGPNSEVARILKFNSIEEIKNQSSQIISFVSQAVELERSGVKIERVQPVKEDWPEELEQVMQRVPNLKEAFLALTPGRQRGYLIYFSSAKNASTRIMRIEKYIDAIFKGKGWNDR